MYILTLSHRRIDFSSVTNKDLEHLVRVCDQETYGTNQETVFNEEYPKFTELDATHFSPLFETGSMNATLTGLLKEEFIPDKMRNVGIRLDRCKLDVYGTESFFLSNLYIPLRGIFPCRAGFFLETPCQYAPKRKHAWFTDDCLAHRMRRWSPRSSWSRQGMGHRCYT